MSLDHYLGTERTGLRYALFALAAAYLTMAAGRRGAPAPTLQAAPEPPGDQAAGDPATVGS